MFGTLFAFVNLYLLVGGDGWRVVLVRGGGRARVGEGMCAYVTFLFMICAAVRTRTKRRFHFTLLASVRIAGGKATFRSLRGSVGRIGGARKVSFMLMAKSVARRKSHTSVGGMGATLKRLGIGCCVVPKGRRAG